MTNPILARITNQGVSSLTDAELVCFVAGASTVSNDLPAPLSTAYANPYALGLTRTQSARIDAARELARRSLACEMRARDSLTSPAAVRGYLRLSMQDLGHECFWAVFLDAQNRVIEAREMFRGTLTQTSVYPREVVKAALTANAAALILAHNHPSGVAEPSVQDQALTRTLAEALALIDVKVLDHFIVAPGAFLSFAERGLI